MAETTLTRTGSTSFDTEVLAPQALDAQVLELRRSPAQHLAEEMALGSGPAVRLREIRFLTQTALRAAPDTSGVADLEAALGLPLPAGVGEVAGAADGSAVAVLWLGPDEFLVVGPDEADGGVNGGYRAATLASALDGQRVQAVDVSANRTTLELSGPSARSVLQKSCQLDLHPREFPVGRAVLTLLETTPVVLWRTADEVWRVMPRASFATHVVRWLLDGMREYV